MLRRFVHGYWLNPKHPQQARVLLEHFRLPLRQLYTLRIKADYELVDIDENIVKSLIELVDETINTILSKGGFQK